LRGAEGDEAIPFPAKMALLRRNDTFVVTETGKLLRPQSSGAGKLLQAMALWEKYHR